MSKIEMCETLISSYGDPTRKKLNQIDCLVLTLGKKLLKFNKSGFLSNIYRI